MSDFVTISVPVKFSRQIGYVLQGLQLGGTVRLTGISQAERPSARGSRNACAVLTEADIPIIRQKLAAGISVSAVASRFKVSRTTIRNVRDGKTWSHITL